MHYENEEVDAFLPNEVIENANFADDTNMNDTFSLPHETENENQVYDKGKEFA